MACWARDGLPRLVTCQAARKHTSADVAQVMKPLEQQSKGGGMIDPSSKHDDIRTMTTQG